MPRFTLDDLFNAYPDNDLLPCGPPESASPEIYAERAVGDTLYQFLIRELFDEGAREDPETQLSRLIRAIADLEAVNAALVARISDEPCTADAVEPAACQVEPAACQAGQAVCAQGQKLQFEAIERGLICVLARHPNAAENPILADMQWIVKKSKRLQEAVEAIYYAAHWTHDRPCDAEQLWTNLRDAAGLKPGMAPKPLDAQAKGT